jgi:hypothetical protein
MYDTTELDDLERDIKQLQIEWDKYFGGLEKRAPTALHAKVERATRFWLRGEIRNPTVRFRSQSLIARFNTLNQLWQKRLRALEEGRPLGVHRGALRVPQTTATPGQTEQAPRRPAAGVGGPQPVRVADVGQDREQVRALFDRFVEARKQAGENAAVRFESFEKLIAQQAGRILTQQGAQAVDFRLETSGGKVSLKARPVK